MPAGRRGKVVAAVADAGLVVEQAAGLIVIAGGCGLLRLPSRANRFLR
jgi:hypothetical protein